MEWQLSRRDFMRQTAGAAGAGLATQSFLLEPRSEFAQGRAVAPSDRVRFGMIGVGMQGSALLRTAIELAGIECAAACDLYDGRLELAREIAERPGASLPTTRRYQDVLENKEIDCVVAAVPDHWHKQIVVDACQAGKDIYCEKPMTHEVSEGFEMIAAEQRNHRIVQIGSQRRSSIVYAKAKELYEQGAIGEVCLIEGSLGRNDPCGAWVYPPPPDLSPRNLDWETWLGSAPKRPFDPIRFARWRCFQDYGEGVPGDLYVHLLTGIHYVTGATAPAARATSVGGLFRWRDGRDVPDCLSTSYEYPKFRATVRVTLNTDTEEVTRLLGTHGVMEIYADRLRLLPQDGKDHDPCYYADSYPKRLLDPYLASWHAAHDPKPGAATLSDSTVFYAPANYSDARDHLGSFFQSVRTRNPSVEDASFGNTTAMECHMANYSYFHHTSALWDEGKKTIRS